MSHMTVDTFCICCQNYANLSHAFKAVESTLCAILFNKVLSS